MNDNDSVEWRIAMIYGFLTGMIIGGLITAILLS